MKKILLAAILITFSFSAAATTLSNEDITIDLNTNKVTADIEVEELTSSSFPYVSSNDIERVNASINGEDVDCSIQESAIGSEIRCPTELRNNFSVNLEYRVDNLVSNRDNIRIFQYEHRVYRPTDSFNLQVLLPDGHAILEETNTTQQVISPLNYETGSNGRQIMVNWDVEPQLGNTLSFYILMNDIQGDPVDSGSISVNRNVIVASIIIILVLLAAGTGYFIYNREDLSENMDELNDDQKDIIEKMRENNGEYLQKDLVDEMDYSKAKISGEVSELVEKGILKKSKEGRSNKLSISRKYSY